MPRIKDVRTMIYEWTGPVAPMPPHFCTTPNDLITDVTGMIAGFRFLGWLIVEIECDDGTIGIGNAILLVSALGYLGLGAQPPEPEWGLMLNTLRTAIYVNPWVAALPGAMIFAVSICFNLLSDGLRSAMDIRS